MTFSINRDFPGLFLWTAFWVNDCEASVFNGVDHAFSGF